MNKTKTNLRSFWYIFLPLMVLFSTLSVQANGICGGTLPADDYDCDGVINSVDLDDDNDGILDTDECVPAATTIVKNGDFSSGFSFWDNTSGMWNTTYSSNNGYALKDDASNVNAFQTIDLTQGLIVNGFYEMTFDLGANNYNNDGSITSNTADFTISIGGVEFVTFYNTATSNTATVTTKNGATINSSTLPVTQVYPTMYSFVLKIPASAVPNPSAAVLDFKLNSSPSGDDFRIDNIVIPKSMTCDLDGDGIANQFDLDTDGDGCPDAIEGGAPISLIQLNSSTLPGGNTGSSFTGVAGVSPVTANLGNVVDANGVPTVVGSTGQSVGSSKNKALQTCQDGDKDKFPDDIDLDNDNDGILDSIECPYVPAYSVYATYPVHGGYASNIPLTITGSNINSAILNETSLTNNLTYGGSNWQLIKSNIMPASDNKIKVELSSVGVGTYIVADAFLVTNGTNYYIVDNTSSNFSNTGTWYTQTYGTAYGTNSFHTDMFPSGVTAKWIFNNLPPIVRTCDLDGDGIPSYLDLDSDGDGCPDALEGGAGFTSANLYTSTFNGGNTGTSYNGTSSSPIILNLGDSVGKTPTTMGVPTIAGTGQSIGTSQNVLSQDVECCVAGYVAPLIVAMDTTLSCPNSINLNTIAPVVANSAKYTAVWSLHNPPSSATDTLTTAQASSINSSGTYYVYYRSKTSGCYSPGDSIRVIAKCTNPDVNVTNINIPVKGDLRTNDNVPSGTTYGSATAVAGNPGSALPVINPDGTYTFVSAVTGKFNFLVPVCPPLQTTNCPLELLTITVIDKYDTASAPVANTDLSQTKTGTPVTIDVKNNDQVTSVGGSLGNPTILSQPKHGTLTTNTDGTITYTPTAGFVGLDTFKYEICDTALNPDKCDSALAIIYVKSTAPSNSLILADDYIYSIGSAQIGGNVLTNDKDPEGNTIAVTPKTVTDSNGTFVLNANGTYTFKPKAGVSGSFNYTYQACDNGSPIVCRTATLYIVIEKQPILTPVLKTTKPILGDLVIKVGLVASIYNMSPEYNSDGPIKVLISKNALYNLTFTNINSVFQGITSVENSKWSFDATSNPNYYVFTSNDMIAVDGKLNFGFELSTVPTPSKITLPIYIYVVRGGGLDLSDENHVDKFDVKFFK